MLAESFFPKEYAGTPECVEIYPKAINGPLTFLSWTSMRRMLTHEFGHILGLRHPHADWRISTLHQQFEGFSEDILRLRTFLMFTMYIALLSLRSCSSFFQTGIHSHKVQT